MNVWKNQSVKQTKKIEGIIWKNKVKFELISNISKQENNVPVSMGIYDKNLETIF